MNEFEQSNHNVYVLAFSNGVIKVGRGKVKSRIATHTTAANIFNVQLVNRFTCFANNPALVENLALKHLSGVCTDKRANEWFYGVDFDAVVGFVESIKESTDDKKRKTIDPAVVEKMFDLFFTAPAPKPCDTEQLVKDFPELLTSSTYICIRDTWVGNDLALSAAWLLSVCLEIWTRQGQLEGRYGDDSYAPCIHNEFECDLFFAATENNFRVFHDVCKDMLKEIEENTHLVPDLFPQNQ